MVLPHFDNGWRTVLIVVGSSFYFARIYIG